MSGRRSSVKFKELEDYYRDPSADSRSRSPSPARRYASPSPSRSRSRSPATRRPRSRSELTSNQSRSRSRSWSWSPDKIATSGQGPRSGGPTRLPSQQYRRLHFQQHDRGEESYSDCSRRNEYGSEDSGDSNGQHYVESSSRPLASAPANGQSPPQVTQRNDYQDAADHFQCSYRSKRSERGSKVGGGRDRPSLLQRVSLGPAEVPHAEGGYPPRHTPLASRFSNPQEGRTLRYRFRLPSRDLIQMLIGANGWRVREIRMLTGVKHIWFGRPNDFNYPIGDLAGTVRAIRESLKAIGEAVKEELSFMSHEMKEVCRDVQAWTIAPDEQISPVRQGSFNALRRRARDNALYTGPWAIPVDVLRSLEERDRPTEATTYGQQQHRDHVRNSENPPPPSGALPPNLKGSIAVSGPNAIQLSDRWNLRSNERRASLTQAEAPSESLRRADIWGLQTTATTSNAPPPPTQARQADYGYNEDAPPPAQGQKVRRNLPKAPPDLEVEVPRSAVAPLIGKGGRGIDNMQLRLNTECFIEQMSDTPLLQIWGTSEQQLRVLETADTIIKKYEPAWRTGEERERFGVGWRPSTHERLLERPGRDDEGQRDQRDFSRPPERRAGSRRGCSASYNDSQGHQLHRYSVQTPEPAPLSHDVVQAHPEAEASHPAEGEVEAEEAEEGTQGYALTDCLAAWEWFNGLTKEEQWVVKCVVTKDIPEEHRSAIARLEAQKELRVKEEWEDAKLQGLNDEVQDQEAPHRGEKDSHQLDPSASPILTTTSGSTAASVSIDPTTASEGKQVELVWPTSPAEASQSLPVEARLAEDDEEELDFDTDMIHQSPLRTTTAYVPSYARVPHVALAQEVVVTSPALEPVKEVSPPLPEEDETTFAINVDIAEGEDAPEIAEEEGEEGEEEEGEIIEERPEVKQLSAVEAQHSRSNSVAVESGMKRTTSVAREEEDPMGPKPKRSRSTRRQTRSVEGEAEEVSVAPSTGVFIICSSICQPPWCTHQPSLSALSELNKLWIILFGGSLVSLVQAFMVTLRHRPTPFDP